MGMWSTGFAIVLAGLSVRLFAIGKLMLLHLLFLDLLFCSFLDNSLMLLELFLFNYQNK